MTGAIAVIGGSYAEECSYPRSTIFRGSGIRAATFLSALNNSVCLNTVLGPNLAANFKGIAKRKGFTLKAVSGSVDICFRYRHPVAKPRIQPATIEKSAAQPAVEAEYALAFGMLEGRAKLLARRAVYDPQDGSRAKGFRSNGSEAKELAIVASLSEGHALTGKSDPESVAKALISAEKCDVVVLKCGPQGALVATSRLRRWIPPFPTSRVWKIGSGDMFSAAFAQAWLVEKSDPISASCFASRVVAEYVETRNETFSSDTLERIRQDAQKWTNSAIKVRPQIPESSIYLAGPFFDTSEQWLVDEARNAFFDMGFKVFSPIHDVGTGPPNVVAPADLHGLRESKLVFALLDGLDPGTIFEIGYARALGIPVVASAENVDPKNLTMFLGSGCTIVDDFSTAVYAACWQMMGNV